MVSIPSFKFSPWALALMGLCWIQGMSAQVKVLNGGFEEFYALPQASGQIFQAKHWSNGGSGVALPDYYHQMGDQGGDLPMTPLAEVHPHSGRAVGGFVAYSKGPNPKYEYVTGQFSEPLETQQRYMMSFYLTSGDVYDWVDAGIGVSGIGVHFGVEAPQQQEYDRLLVNPHFDLTQSIYDHDWVKVAFNFTASQPYTTFTVGKFDSDARLREEEDGERTIAYYFVDDFRIEPIDFTGIGPAPQGRGPRGYTAPDGCYFPNAFTPDGDGLNDVWSPTFPKGFQGRVAVFNRWGHVIWEEEVDGGTLQTWDGLDQLGSTVENGVYGWRMTSEIAVEGQTEWTGLVNLIR